MNNTPDSIDIMKLEEQVKKIPSGIRREIMQRLNQTGCTELVKIFILQGQISGSRYAAESGQLDTLKFNMHLVLIQQKLTSEAWKMHAKEDIPKLWIFLLRKLALM